MVLNLAAGLDARPYRMDLPASLQWVEVDLPELIAYKEEALEGEKPACVLQRVPLDLSDGNARRALFQRLGERSRQAVIVTEGLLIYLAAEDVGSLARDLAAPPGFRHWAVDLCSPGLLRILQKQIGSPLVQAGAPLKFGPEEGPEFFAPHGWRPVEVHSMLRTAAREKRVPIWMRALALLPESQGRQGPRPWGGVCALSKQAP
jgi:O-methyltransferase involved in polyketide biosynthesis